MTNSIERTVRLPNKPAHPAPLAQKRRGSAGEVEQGGGRDRSKAVAQGRASSIRAWRAGEPEPSQTPGPEPRSAAATKREAAGREAGARPGALERAARIRAIEQAWKEECARQAELQAQER